MSMGNDFPRSFSQSMTHRGSYGDGNPSPSNGNRRQLELDHWSPFLQDNRRIGAPAEYRPFDERLAIRPFGLARIPTEPPTRIIIMNSNMDRGMNPRLPQFQQRVTPRFLSQGNMHIPHSQTTNDSKLTKEEQESVLKQLKKEIYNPVPKTLARRVSLYYRELNRDPIANDKDKYKDEDGKRCAVCLEDFEPREEVMLTPCNHMFHEECIVPWVKSHGQCAVCRFALFERMKDGSTLNSNTGALPADHDLFANELLSVIQAVDEAFPWGPYMSMT